MMPEPIAPKISPPADRIPLVRPDDLHVHLRDGAMLAAEARHTAAQFARAIIMPNLVPPVTTADAARAYLRRILEALLAAWIFPQFITCSLTYSSADDVDETG